MPNIIVDLRPIEFECVGLTEDDIYFYNYGSLETQEEQDRHKGIDHALHQLLYKRLKKDGLEGVGWITDAEFCKD